VLTAAPTVWWWPAANKSTQHWGLQSNPQCGTLALQGQGHTPQTQGAHNGALCAVTVGSGHVRPSGGPPLGGLPVRLSARISSSFVAIRRIERWVGAPLGRAPARPPHAPHAGRLALPRPCVARVVYPIACPVCTPNRHVCPIGQCWVGGLRVYPIAPTMCIATQYGAGQTARCATRGQVASKRPARAPCQLHSAHHTGHAPPRHAHHARARTTHTRTAPHTPKGYTPCL
jgi:hypothetical protein